MVRCGWIFIVFRKSKAVLFMQHLTVCYVLGCYGIDILVAFKITPDNCTCIERLDVVSQQFKSMLFAVIPSVLSVSLSR